MPNTPTEMATTTQVAKAIGKDVSTVHRLVKAGQLTPVAKAPGIRGAYLFDPADVSRLQSAITAA